MYEVKQVRYKDTKWFILDLHYAKRMPQVQHAFGLYHNNFLTGVVTYGKPASHYVTLLCGKKYSNIVLELNRLVLMHNNKNEASMLIGRSIKLLPKPAIIVSYSDTAHDHVGYVYQATNFIYLGKTRQRTDMIGINDNHPRHYNVGETKRVIRSAKHKYVYVHASKTDKRNILSNLKIKSKQYPK